MAVDPNSVGDANIKIDVTEAGVDRLYVEGPASIAIEVWKEWAQKMEDVRKETRSVIEQAMTEQRPGRTKGSVRHFPSLEPRS